MRPFAIAIVLTSACVAPRATQMAADAGSDACTPLEAERALARAAEVRTEVCDASIDAAIPIDARAPADAAVPIDARPAVDAFAPIDAASPRPSRSPGCGLGGSGTGDFEAHTIRVGGVDRVYRLRIPSSYDAERAYPIVFRWHGFGGDGSSGGLGIEYAAGEEAIVVAPDAIGGAWDLGPEGADVALFDALFGALSSERCIDLDRVFSYGFSRGGGMTSLLACIRPDVLRASAAVAGLEPTVVECDGPVAVWFLHDSDDGAVPIAQGARTRDRFLRANGCAETSAPVDPSPCARYDGCVEDDPVVWCETSGRGHDIRGDFAPAAVWEFFSSLR
jgi:polyhydroxybutyrate depolymerase